MKNSLLRFVLFLGLYLLMSLTVKADPSITNFDLPGSTAINSLYLKDTQLGDGSYTATLQPGGSYLYYYIAPYVQVSQSGSFDFGQTRASTDTVMALYQGSFDPLKPQLNLIYFNDDWSSSRVNKAAIEDTPVAPPGIIFTKCGASAYRCPALEADLVAGIKYIMVVSHFETASAHPHNYDDGSQPFLTASEIPFALPMSFFCYSADGYTCTIGVYSSGPAVADTQASMQYQSSQLRSAFNTQTVAANLALNYDCNVFDIKGMCISAGGRYTTIDNPGINNSAAVVTLGYKVNPNIRIGAYLDQNINISKPTGVNISNNTPLMGLYAVWNKEPSGLGYQVRIANTYQDKDVTSTRTVFDTSEAGSGKSSLKSQSYLAELSYAFQYEDRTLVRPYAGLRYTHLKQNGYTEETTDTVTDPLTVAALRDKSATALLGVKVNRSLTDKATLTAQLGLEQDLYHKVDHYSATDLNGSDLTAVAFNSNIKRTRPVASLGAFYDVTKTQRASATINYQQTPFQATGSATAYFNYMIGF